MARGSSTDHHCTSSENRRGLPSHRPNTFSAEDLEQSQTEVCEGVGRQKPVTLAICGKGGGSKRGSLETIHGGGSGGGSRAHGALC